MLEDWHKNIGIWLDPHQSLPHLPEPVGYSEGEILGALLHAHYHPPPFAEKFIDGVHEGMGRIPGVARYKMTLPPEDPFTLQVLTQLDDGRWLRYAYDIRAMEAMVIPIPQVVEDTIGWAIRETGEESY